MADQFPDRERIETMKQLASKEWITCKKCDWFFKAAVLDLCPMCHQDWRKAVPYQQPAYETPSLE